MIIDTIGSDLSHDRLLALNSRLAGSKYVRLFHDVDPGKKWYAADWYPETLWDVIIGRKALSVRTKETIVRDVLRGIAEFHARDLLHADIKAGNILVNLQEGTEHDGQTADTKIYDLEESFYAPPGMDMASQCIGSYLWRSPEAHLCGRCSKPTGIFSFRAVADYHLASATGSCKKPQSFYLTLHEFSYSDP